jgi:hypothetical protein
MAFQRERFLVRCAAAVIGAQLVTAVLVMGVCLGGWGANRRLCDGASKGVEVAFETALGTTLALLSGSGLLAASRRQRPHQNGR